VLDKCKPADKRGDDFNLYWVPTTYYDGGDNVLVGGNKTQILNSINDSAARTVLDVDVKVSALWLGDAVLRISASVVNNSPRTYEGHIRVYIQELLSSLGWKDTNGKTYTNAMLEFAMNESITIAQGDTWSKTVEWDGNLFGTGFGQTYGNISYDNIRVLAAVFNDEWHQGFSDPPTGQPFDAYYVDDTAGVMAALPLSCDVHTVPESGGTVNIDLLAGVDNASRNYLIVGSTSGTSPGFTLPGGEILPINWDWFSDLEMTLLGPPIFTDFMGTLGAEGIGSAQFNVPTLPAGSAGLIMYFAYCCNNPFDFVSNPVEIEVVP
jgi:hypothetical protein